MNLFLRGVAVVWCLLVNVVAMGQTDRNNYIKHYSGLFLCEGAGAKAQLQKEDKTVRYYMTRAFRGYYFIIKEEDGSRRYLNLSGDRDLVFSDDNTTTGSHFAVEKGEGGYSLLKCRANGKYVGTDDTRAGSAVYCDKEGNRSKHLWYLSEAADALPEPEEVKYLLNPEAVRQVHEGWGVSLCWWANMCGRWSDADIDKIIDWLVSPKGLNYSVFRYNIGGGDDPEHRNCDPQHMRSGKGQRAEMEGFKDSTDGGYIWTRDAAQRKIMLKIREKRPDAIFEAFSNSAPYYMTYSGCTAGNDDAWKDNLRPEYYDEFAHYLVDVCRHYKEEYGIEFRTLEPFNEPGTDYWGRNGGQEGCHFDLQSQIAFIKVLYPILKASGLGTVISASDQCWADAAANDLKAYKEAGIADMVGQWNTHTYYANNELRTQLNALAHDAGKRLWMSETGSGGDGIKGNLDMTRRLFDDVRYLECESWHDWQYVEEWNDQWCMVKADFANATYQRVKNYYVRQHVTRFIKPGYRFVATSDDNTLAAVSAESDTIVLVALNTGNVRKIHECRLMGCEPAAAPSVYLTTASGSMVKTACDYADGVMRFTMPDLSIATFIMPLKRAASQAAEVRDGAYCLIQPQYNRPMALTAKEGKVTIEATACSDGWHASDEGGTVSPVSGAQTWQLLGDNAQGYMLKNGEGAVIYGNAGYYLNAAAEPGTDASVRFDFTRVNRYGYKITPHGDNRAFDLENARSDAGTNVGLWDYGTDVTQCHRNWQLIPLQLPEADASANTVELPAVKVTAGRNMLTVSAPQGGKCNVTVYALDGARKADVDFEESVSVPLASGYYVAAVTVGNKAMAVTVRVR